MKQIITSLLLCLPILMFGKGGVPSSTSVSNTEQNRYTVIAPGEMCSFCYRIDTKTGAVYMIDVSEKGDNTRVIRLEGGELISETQSRNGRFQAYIAPYPAEREILLIDTETGKMYQSNQKRKILLEIIFE